MPIANIPIEGGVRPMLQPLADRVLVKPLEAEDKTEGGIILPETAKERPREGEVIAVGPGRRGPDGELIPLPVQVGDIVIYTEYGGTEVKVDGEKYLIIEESSLLAARIPEEEKKSEAPRKKSK
jgi:chaperonin GroES